MNWQNSTLGRCAEVLDHLRKPINSNQRQNRIIGKHSNELVPYYGATGQVGWIDDFLTNEELVLIGEDGAPFLDRFKPKSYLIKGKAWVNNHAHILKGKAGILDNNYLLHYLNSFNYHGYVNGTTRLKLTKGKLVDIPITLPPLPIQQAIVAKLEALFSELDKGIEQLKTARQQLRTYRQAVLRAAFEGRLTGEQVKEGVLPEGWKWIKMGEVAFAIDPQPSHRTPPIDEQGIPYVGIGEIDKNTGTIDFANARKVPNSVLDEHIARYPLIEGDFIIGKIGTIGKPFKVPTKRFYALSANVVLVQANREKATSSYLFYLCQSNLIEKQFQSGSKATTQAAFGIKKVRDLEIPICGITEQENIVSEIESRLSVADKLEETIAQGLQQAEALRQSILKKAFEGDC